MTPSQELHTYARRYCLERHGYWVEQYEQLPKRSLIRKLFGIYTNEANGIFPRHHILRAMLMDIESLDYDALPDLSDLIEFLDKVGQSANAAFKGKYKNKIADAAEKDERDLFIQAMLNAGEAGVSPQRRLFYRHVMNKKEISIIRLRLKEKWGVTDEYWYPLGEKTHDSLVALNLCNVDEARLQQAMHEFFADNAIHRIYELREFGDENYVLDTEEADLSYNGIEGYWISESNDWIVYCSHHETITLGGRVTAVLDRLHLETEAYST